MDVSELLDNATEWNARLRAARTQIGDGIAWYQYDTLANLWHLDALLHGDNRDLVRLAAGLPVADIGAADGDLAFMLEDTCGWEIDVIDHGPTNQNGLRGARALRDHLGSRVQIEDIDLDSQFRLPREHYGLVLMLGILYHLQNPFFVLHELSQRADHCLLSTRVARFAGPERTPLADLPIAYLVGPSETNNDATNYWMFSPAGLERILDRAGWSVLERHSAGDVGGSDPYSPDHDERMIVLLQSSRLTPRPDGANEAEPQHRELEALRRRAATLERELQTAREQAAALRNMKVVRWTAAPRRLVYKLRARGG